MSRGSIESACHSGNEAGRRCKHVPESRSYEKLCGSGPPGKWLMGLWKEKVRWNGKNAGNPA